MYNFTLVNCDTDSISICKKDQSTFTPEEEIKLLQELNALFPEGIRWEDDGTFETVIVLKAKNYILKETGKAPKIKGSALKNLNKEKRLRDFMKEIIIELGIGRNNFVAVYNKYVKEISNITDISEWVTKKTITEAVLKNDRANESKVRDALEGVEFSEGDKKYIFFKSDNTICLKENFNGDYSKDKLYDKLFATCKVFANVIPENTFINYKLKRNKKALEELLK